MVSLEKRISVGKFIVIILILCLLTALPVILIRHASADPAQETNAQASSEETSSAPETPLQKYGKLNDIRIRLTFDRSTETLDIKTIGDWVSVSRKGDQYTYTTDDEKIKRYTKAQGCSGLSVRRRRITLSKSRTTWSIMGLRNCSDN